MKASCVEAICALSGKINNIYASTPKKGYLEAWFSFTVLPSVSTNGHYTPL